MRQNGKARVEGECRDARGTATGPRTEPTTDDRARNPAFSTSRGEPTWAVPLVDWSTRRAWLGALVAPRESHQSSATVVAFLSCYLRRRTEKIKLPICLSLSLLSYPSPFPSADRSPRVFVSTGEDTLVSGSVEVAHVFTRGAPPVYCDALHSAPLLSDNRVSSEYRASDHLE